MMTHILKKITHQAKDSFKTSSFKPIAMTMIVIAGLLFTNTAFANRWRVTNLSVGNQVRTATYGTAATGGTALTYAITLSESNVNQNPQNTNALSITWTGGTPTGVTTSIATTPNYTPNSNNQNITLTINTTAATPAGTFAFTITTNENNGGTSKSDDGTLVVLQRPLTLTGTLDANNKPYDGTTTATLTGTDNLTAGGVIAGDNVTLTGTPTGVFQTTGVGTNKPITISGYTLGGTSAAKYTLTQPTGVTANITALPLTITATDPGKTYGTALPSGASTINFTSSAPLAGETVTSVTLTPNANGLSTTATAGSAYTVVPSAPTGTGGFSAANYTITFTNFNGTIGKALLTITANDASKVYGTTTLTNGTKNNTFFTTTGLKNGQTVTNVVIAYGTGAAATDPVGNYANQVTPSGATGSFSTTNYTVSYVQGDINVTAAALAVKATNQTKAYGAAVPTLTFTTTGFVNGDGFTTQPTLTTTATAASNGGTYPITFATQGTVSTNYTATYTAGTLTVTAEPSLYDWTGAANTTWNNPANWNVSGIPQTTLYPGSTSNDDAQIGVTGTFTNQPVLTATLPNNLNSITFGSSAGATSLTINAAPALNVGDFIVNANSTTNIIDNGTVNVSGTFTNNASASLTISGSKSFAVQVFTGFSTITNAGILTQTGTGSVTFSNSAFAANIINSGTINQSGSGAFMMSITAVVGTLTNSGIINQTSSGSFTATGGALFGVSFNNSGQINQTGNSTMTFGVAYSNSTAGSKLTQTGSGTIAFSSTFNNKGTTIFGPGIVTIANDFTNSSGTTTFGAGTATLSGDFTNTSGTTAFGAGPATVSGDYSNNGTVTSSTGTISFGSANFTNSGPLTFGTGLVTFTHGPSVTKFDANTDITFVNVSFTGGSNVQFPHSGNLFLASTGVLSMSNATHFSLAGGSFTLLSDANSSATIAAIPANCSMNIPVNVQRYIQGGVGHRGYRLLSSTVFTGTVNGTNVSDFQYLLSNQYISGAGGAANGFNVPTTQNPTIYLFREDSPPPPTDATLFTTGYNWKGVAKINNSPTYNIGIQAKATTTNISDTTVNLPVGNGILFFFRGAMVPANLSSSGIPQNVTLTQTGTLNTGTVNVKVWFAGGANNLGNNLSYTASTDTGNHALRGGYNLVGNPYPSTINWEKYNNNNASGAITGTVPATIWMLNPTNKQYEAYIPLANDADVTSEFTSTSINGGTAQNAASNFIASGQAFFVKASAIGQTLTFNETAKISAQPTAANLNMLMGKPKDVAVAPRPLLRLKLMLDSVNTDEIAIRLDNKASAKFADGEDAEDLGGSSALVSLSSYTSDGVQSSINAMPFPGVKPQVIPLFVSSTSSGSYKLVMPQLKNLPILYEVWLKDAFTADSVQLQEGTTYAFTIDKANAATFGNTRFSMVIRQNPANAYKLLDFTATKDDHKTEVELIWKTANEGNYTNFTVERSTDNGKTFQVIGGMHSTAAGTYSLLDKKPDNGKNLYRLKQEDINDTITYSKVVEIKYGDKRERIADNVYIYPNPASHTINLSIDDKEHVRASYSIRFMNCFGLIIKQVNSSDAEWQGNISNLRPGTYLIRVVNNRTEKLVGENKFVKL